MLRDRHACTSQIPNLQAPCSHHWPEADGALKGVAQLEHAHHAALHTWLMQRFIMRTHFSSKDNTASPGSHQQGKMSGTALPTRQPLQIDDICESVGPHGIGSIGTMLEIARGS